MLSIMHSFMKATRFIHVNLEGTKEYKIVYNHHKKIVKIENEWRNFT